MIGGVQRNVYDITTGRFHVTKVAWTNASQAEPRLFELV